MLALVGEALPPLLCQKWFGYFKNTPLLNSYGPTECSDGVSHYLIYEGPDDSVINMPIGKAIKNLKSYILEPNTFNEVEFGDIGELCVSGIGVSRGYIYDEERTKKAFFENPFAEDERNKVLYRTGDLVKYLPNGDMEYLGRIDRQVKIRGFRIELAEIETYITKFGHVKGCAVVPRKRHLKQEKIVARECLVEENNNDEEVYLVAYLVCDAKIRDYELKQYLKVHLPSYMVPDVIIKIDELPLNSNGKIDVKALPEPDHVRPDLEVDYVEPETELQAKLAAIWQSILDIDRIGILDNFLELGGDSLLTMRTLNTIEEVLNVKLSFQDVLKDNIKVLAEKIIVIQNETKNDEQEVLVAPEDGLYRPSFEQQRLWFLWKLEPNNSFYTLQGTVNIKGDIKTEFLKKYGSMSFKHMMVYAHNL